VCGDEPAPRAAYVGLDWKTVKEIDKRYLAARLGPVDLSGVTILGLDEFAIQKGHRYATMVIEPARERVLWVGRGRAREDLRPFFRLLGSAGCARLEAVVMDMSAAYREEVAANAPNARIVYDPFHVVAKYGVRWSIACGLTRRTDCTPIAGRASSSRAHAGCCSRTART